MLWFVVPIAFGLLSLAVGQDANWDLQNYHLYNPYAILTGRVGVDLAPAGLQTYFNPLLDLPYYWMVMNLPPMVVGGIMGAVHGLNFVLLIEIVRIVLPRQTGRWSIFFLALSGCLGAVFLSELGNSMGDNTTALFVLSAVLIVLRYWSIIESGRARAIWICAGAGLAVGLGAGLKLTNAPYAVGIFLALTTLGGPLRGRFLLMLVFGVGVIAGISITAGYWFITMWEHFRNPLFPMFNSIFQSDMAAVATNSDARWLPRNAWEVLLFPYVFTISPARFGEVIMVQLLWPIVYTLFGVWLVCSILSRFGLAPCAPQQASESPPAQARFLVVFLVASYLVWMTVFSIGRYLVVIETLLPVATWMLLHRLTTPARASKLALGFIGVAVLLSVIRFDTWGSVSWSEKSYSVNVPTITRPETATVLMLGAPFAWVLPFFPRESVFIGFGIFPESDGYRQRAASIIESRPGGLFAILPANLDGRAQSIHNLNEWVREKAVRRSDGFCSALTWTLKRLPRFKLAVGTASSDNVNLDLCTFELPPEHRRDIVGENRLIAQNLSDSISHRGLRLDLQTCVIYSGYIGQKNHVYQFCTVRKVAH